MVCKKGIWRLWFPLGCYASFLGSYQREERQEGSSDRAQGQGCLLALQQHSVCYLSCNSCRTCPHPPGTCDSASSRLHSDLLPAFTRLASGATAILIPSKQRVVGGKSFFFFFQFHWEIIDIQSLCKFKLYSIKVWFTHIVKWLP